MQGAYGHNGTSHLDNVYLTKKKKKKRLVRGMDITHQESRYRIQLQPTLAESKSETFMDNRKTNQ